MAINRYGVDVTYFEKWIVRSLKDLENYKPDELARELGRMSRTADSSVLLEEEFCGDIQANKVYQQERIEHLESELNRAQSNVKRQGIMLSKAMGEFIELTDELREANAAIRWMDELFERTDTWKGWKGDEIHLPAIDRALKES